MIGRRIDQYRIEASLGKGGMATVWRGVDVVLNRAVAIKILADSLADNPAARHRFRREAEIATLLNHPAIAPVYEHGATDGLTWISMMLIEGETLAQILERRLFSESETCETALRATEANFDRGPNPDYVLEAHHSARPLAAS